MALATSRKTKNYLFRPSPDGGPPMGGNGASNQQENQRQGAPSRGLPPRVPIFGRTSEMAAVSPFIHARQLYRSLYGFFEEDFDQGCSASSILRTSQGWACQPRDWLLLGITWHLEVSNITAVIRLKPLGLKQTHTTQMISKLRENRTSKFHGYPSPGIGPLESEVRAPGVGSGLSLEPAGGTRRARGTANSTGSGQVTYRSVRD